MSFISPVFFIFLPAVLALYHALPHRWQNRMLLAASYIFYGWWDWRYLGLVMLSTGIDFVCANAMGDTEDPRARKRWVTLSVVSNLTCLGFFKYYDFFAVSAADALGALGFQAHAPTLNLLLPVGISFYTLQSIAYTVDVYRRDLEPVRDPLDFALYVAYFPQLVAGPIERATNLVPQVTMPRRVTKYQVLSGCWMILFGYFKKVAIADNVAPYVDSAFADLGQPGAVIAGGVLLFALQAYGDFMGYTDIARGVSRLMGIELMVNFRRPFLAKTVAELWRRWHISLSTFFRDYLYIPLGGNRAGEARTMWNLFFIMTLCGFWHGANWGCILWGAFHGAYLVAHRLLMRILPKKEAATAERDRHGLVATRLVDAPKVLAVFAFFCIPLAMMRGQTYEGAMTATYKFLCEFFVGSGADFHNYQRFAFFMGILILIDCIQETMRTDEPFPIALPWPLAACVAALMILAILVFGGQGSAFIYFQF